MKKLIFLILSAFPLLSAGQAISGGDAILGKKWWTGPKQEAQIEFFRNPGDSTFYAKLVWMLYPDLPDGSPALDVKNPDRALRSRPMLGMNLIDTLAYNGNGQWFTRRMYVPEEGIYVRAHITLEGDGNLGLRVSKLGVVVDKTFVKVPPAAAGTTSSL